MQAENTNLAARAELQRETSLPARKFKGNREESFRKTASHYPESNYDYR
jgi:hypothetical protein